MSSQRVYRTSVPHRHMHSARSDLGGRRERGINGEVQRIRQRTPNPFLTLRHHHVKTGTAATPTPRRLDMAPHDHKPRERGVQKFHERDRPPPARRVDHASRFYAEIATIWQSNVTPIARKLRVFFAQTEFTLQLPSGKDESPNFEVLSGRPFSHLEISRPSTNHDHKLNFKLLLARR